MDQKKARTILNKYLEKVSRTITIRDALLYGSVAEGRARPDSDIDILIISDDFAALDTDERLKLLYRATVGIPYDLHISGVTPDEYQSASDLTTLGTIKRGKTIPLH